MDRSTAPWGLNTLRPHSSSVRQAFPLAGLAIAPAVSMLLADRRLAWIARLGDRTMKGNAGAQVWRAVREQVPGSPGSRSG